MRERLIELLGADVCKHDCCDDCEHQGSTDACVAELKAQMADHLIANGVAVFECGYDCKNCWKTQLCTPKWIPVTEATPEESTNVLLRIKSQTTGTTAVTVGYCYTYYWCHQPMGLRWFERWRASYEPAGGVLDDSWDVTHWMELPKEPKEDDNG